MSVVAEARPAQAMAVTERLELPEIMDVATVEGEAVGLVWEARAVRQVQEVEAAAHKPMALAARAVLAH